MGTLLDHTGEQVCLIIQTSSSDACQPSEEVLTDQSSSQRNKPVQVLCESAAVVVVGPSLIGTVRLIGRAPAARSHTYGTINNGWLD